MRSTKEIKAKLAECAAKAEALDEVVRQESREFNEVENKAISDIHSEVESLKKELDTATKYEAIVESKLASKLEAQNQEQQPTNRVIPPRVKSFFQKGVFNTAEDAYLSGQYILATIFGNKRAKQYCVENGLRIRRVSNAMTTGDNANGGFLVPEPLEASIVELRQQFGVFARYAQPVNMSEAVVQQPKLAGEMTSYYVGENQTITASDLSINLVRLEAKKLAGVAVISSELSEDSVISVAEAFARSAASKFSFDEDNAGFNGDGTSTFGGIVGAKSALAAGSVATATGITTNAGLTMAVFENAIGRLPEYAGIQPAWFFHKNVWANGPERLLDAVGGNNNGDIANGAPMRLKGYPVIISQALYSGAGATGETFGYFGDLRMAAMLGRRRGMSMQADNSIYFLQDATAIRVTQRYDINVHDRGTASAAGALVALRFG